MSKREPLRGYRRRMKKEESSHETPARGRAEDMDDQKLTSSSRSDRFRRRQDVKEQDDQYELVLKASGIDTDGMDEEEKIELAKILVLSKSEVEQTSGDMCIESPLAGIPTSAGREIPGTSTEALRRSPSRTEDRRRSPASTRTLRNPTPSTSDSSSDSSVVCLDLPEVKPVQKPVLGQMSTQKPDLGQMPVQNSDLEQMSTQKPDLGHMSSQNPDFEQMSSQNPDFEQMSTQNPDLGNKSVGQPILGNMSTEKPALEHMSTQYLKELEEEEYDETQRSPLNGSMSHIFSDEEETQPLSQDLFSKTEDGSQGHGNQESDQGRSSQRSGQDRGKQDFNECYGCQGASHVDTGQQSTQRHVSQGSIQDQEPVQGSSVFHKESFEEIDIADCPTLTEDLVDGNFPVTSDYHGHGKSNQQVLSELQNDSKSHKTTFIEVKVQSLDGKDSHQMSQRSLSPVEGGKPPDGAGRKRKATQVLDPEPKQSRLEVDIEEPISFSMGTYLLDTDKSHPSVTKPLKRHYRRQRRSMKEKKYFSSSSSSADCNRYTEVIFQLLEAYRMELRDAQCGRLTHLPWGEPVKVGRHMSKTIDLKKRGRGSCYFEQPDSEEEALEEFAAEKAREQAESEFGTQIDLKGGVCKDKSVRKKKVDKYPDISPLIDFEDDEGEDDFVCIKEVSHAKKRKSLDPSPEVEELPDVEGWLCSRGVNSGKNKSLSTRGRHGRGKGIKKPELDFVQAKSAENQFEREVTGKRTRLSVQAPNKTYGKKSNISTKLVRSDSPVFLVDDEILSSEEESSTQACPTRSMEKRSVCKTFTFKSTASGKVEVSTAVDVESEDEDLEEVRGHDWPRQTGLKPELLSHETSPTFSRLRTANRADSARIQKNSVDHSELQSKEVDVCSVEEIPSTLAEGDAEALRAGDNMRTDSDRDTWDKGHLTNKNKERGIGMESETNADDDNIDEKKFGTGKKSTSARCLKLLSSRKATQQSRENSTILDLANTRSKWGSLPLEPKVEKVEEDNFYIPSSAVFHSRKKRHSSNFFSESDDSFNLGVTPVKAFPAIFESSSDSSPSSSGRVAATTSPKFESKARLPVADDQQIVKTSSLIFPDDDDDDDDVYNATTEEDSSVEKKSQTVSEVKGVRRKHNALRKDKEHKHSAKMEEQVRGQGSDSGSKADNGHNDKTTEGMACPLCGVTFSMQTIETHASACDGVPPVETHASVCDKIPPGKVAHLNTGHCLLCKLRVGLESHCLLCLGNGGNGRAEDWEFALGQGRDDTWEGGEESCYICDGVFTKGEEYQRHVDECLAEARRRQEQMEKGPKVRRSRATRNRPIRDGEDEKDGGPPGKQDATHKKRKVETGDGMIHQEITASRPRFSTSESEMESDVDESRDSGEYPRGVPAPGRKPGTDIDFSAISNSPVKTFRKIGQLDGCLIDFSNQFKKADKIKRKPAKTRTKRKRKTGKRRTSTRKKSVKS